MLRQIALSTSQPGMPGFGQPQPVYVQGYGFVPPSQVCVWAGGCRAARGFSRTFSGRGESQRRLHLPACLLPACLLPACTLPTFSDSQLNP